MIARTSRSRSPPICQSPCPFVTGSGGHERRAGQGMRRFAQPRAVFARAHLNDPLDLNINMRSGRAHLAVLTQQVVTPAPNLRHAHCLEDVEAFPPRTSAAGAARRPCRRAAGGPSSNHIRHGSRTTALCLQMHALASLSGLRRKPYCIFTFRPTYDIGLLKRVCMILNPRW